MCTSTLSPGYLSNVHVHCIKSYMYLAWRLGMGLGRRLHIYSHVYAFKLYYTRSRVCEGRGGRERQNLKPYINHQYRNFFANFHISHCICMPDFQICIHLIHVRTHTHTYMCTYILDIACVAGPERNLPAPPASYSYRPGRATGMG